MNQIMSSNALWQAAILRKAGLLPRSSYRSSREEARRGGSGQQALATVVDRLQQGGQLPTAGRQPPLPISDGSRR